jgi:site-specific DNA recombinase
MNRNTTRKERASTNRPAAEPKAARKRAVVYLRVSSAEQEREGFSIPSQRKLLNEYAAQAGIAVVHEFIDVETAKKAGRTGFSEMVSFLSRHQCQTILVEKTDRLYRNIKDWVLIDELGLEIHFVKENVVLSSDSRSSEKFLHGIKVLMAKNYIDNLSEEVRKGMLEKASQGHWPSCPGRIPQQSADPTYRTRPGTSADHRDAVRVVRGGRRIPQGGHASRSSRRSCQSVLRPSSHEGEGSPATAQPAVLRRLRLDGEAISGPPRAADLPCAVRSSAGGVERANRPLYSKHGHPFAGLLTCGRCGCAITAELKKQQYLYYHCTGSKGPCGNTWIRDEDLRGLLADVIRQIHIPVEIADRLADALRESQADKERFSRTSLMRLQQQQLQVQAKLDKAYDDRLTGPISEELWARRASEWEAEINRVRGEMARLEDAGRDYAVTGLRILELAKSAYSRFNSHDPVDQAKLLKTVLSNCTFDRGSLCPTYNKPFDLFAGGNESGEWLLRLDSNQQPSG